MVAANCASVAVSLGAHGEALYCEGFFGALFLFLIASDLFGEVTVQMQLIFRHVLIGDVLYFVARAAGHLSDVFGAESENLGLMAGLTIAAGGCFLILLLRSML